jgi:hypothetical protein
MSARMLKWILAPLCRLTILTGISSVMSLASLMREMVVGVALGPVLGAELGPELGLALGPALGAPLGPELGPPL